MDFCTLLILDGFGVNPSKKGNPIKEQGTPYLDSLKKKYPNALLKTSGEDVGKVKGQMGDSEVGHMNIGSGRVAVQNILKINKAIKDKSFFSNDKILQVMKHVKENNSNLHIMGLLSDGGIHSMYQHLFAFLKMAKQNKIKNTYIHVFTDGRDTGTKDGIKFIKLLEAYMKKIKYGTIASVSGRFYAMDREQNYDRTKVFYDILVNGKGEVGDNIETVVEESYKNGTFDEFIVPHMIKDCDGIHTLNNKDGLILFNYRKDRPRQILEALSKKDFDKFETKKLKNVKILTPVQISKDFKNILYAFDETAFKNTLSEVISDAGFNQLKIAETTKYAHVTYYLNGTIEQPFKNEDRKLFESDKIKNFADKPQMQAYKIADFAKEQIQKQKYKLIVINIANGDMIGHTGDFQAAKKTIQTIEDVCKEIVEATTTNGGTVVVAADHGNIEFIQNKDGSKNTQHTTFDISCILVNDNLVGKKMLKGRLADISPTILSLLNIKIPKEMTGKVLLRK